MKQTTYKCDICGDESEFDMATKRLIGFEFGHGIPATPEQKFMVRPIRDVERHICLPCLRGLGELAAEVGKAK